jgi:hypothetical protein
VKEQISSQLLLTLSGAGQGQQQVQSIALYIGDNAFAPPGAQGNPVQKQAKYQPVDNPTGSVFYYLDPDGALMRVSGPSGTPVKIAKIGTGYSGLAVSPDGQYVAALRGGNVYTGEVGASSLTVRVAGGGFTSLSWDRYDILWAAGSTGVVTLSAAAKSGSTPAQVNIQSWTGACPSDSGDVTAVRVAPDGVRVALVFGGQQQALAFGAIVRPDQFTIAQSPPMASIQLSPFVVCGAPNDGVFRSLSWYGAEEVIALSEPGDVVTEYPVNGGTPTTLPDRPGMRSITGYFDGETTGLVSGLNDGTMSVDTSINGAWTTLNYHGQYPAYPG